MLCSWARHLTLTVPLSTQVYKWVPANCWGNLTNCGEVTCDGLASRPGGVEILLAASCYGNRDKLRQHEPVLAFKASLYYFFNSYLYQNAIIRHQNFFLPSHVSQTQPRQCSLKSRKLNNIVFNKFPLFLRFLYVLVPNKKPFYLGPKIQTLSYD